MAQEARVRSPPVTPRIYLYNDVVTIEDTHWLAGILEGEGTFMKGPPSDQRQPIVRVQMTDRDVIERVARLMGVSVVCLKARSSNWKNTFCATLRGGSAVALMQVFFPLMGVRRKQQIEKAIQSYSRHARFKLDRDKVEVIKARLHNGESHTQIAKDYGVDRSHISQIKSGRRWA